MPLPVRRISLAALASAAVLAGAPGGDAPRALSAPPSTPLTAPLAPSSGAGDTITSRLKTGRQGTINSVEGRTSRKKPCKSPPSRKFVNPCRYTKFFNMKRVPAWAKRKQINPYTGKAYIPLEEIWKAAVKRNVDPALELAVIDKESGGYALSYNRKSKASGPLQFIPWVARDNPKLRVVFNNKRGLARYIGRGRGTQDPLFHVILSYRAGALYLFELTKTYKSTREALKFYSGGSASYADDVMKRYMRYRNPNGPGHRYRVGIATP